MKACYLPHSKPMIQHDDSLRTITQDRISDPSGQFNRKLNFRLREVNIAQFKMALSLLWIAFPVLARILHEGFGIQSVAGKAGWTIACRVIALAMAQGGSFKLQSQMRSEPE